jgi:uncharacterized protein YjeT (DUF2065 family)
MAMYIAQFLQPLALAPHVEVVEAMLPDLLPFFWKQLLLLPASSPPSLAAALYEQILV